MTDGVLIMCNNDTESQREACACAYSIKNFNENAKISLLISDLDQFDSSYEEPFDDIIELPFKTNSDCDTNIWQSYWCTPYDNTLIINKRCIVSQSFDELWRYLEYNNSVCYPTQTLDFKGNLNLDKRYPFLDHYGIQRVFPDIIYFKKDDTALAYFKLMDIYFQNWKDLLNASIDKGNIPKDFDKNIMHSITAHHFTISDELFSINPENFTYVDMSSSYSLFERQTSRWTDYLNVWTTSGARIKLQNFSVVGTISYELPEFLTEEIFNGQQEQFRRLYT